jgi:hypothetical protein
MPVTGVRFMATTEIYIDGQGHILTFGDFKLEDIGIGMPILGGSFKEVRLTRIVPVKRVKRWAFEAARSVGDTGKIADWTRRWRGPWQVVRMESGEVLHSALTRSACLAFEREFLRKTVMEK